MLICLHIFIKKYSFIKAIAELKQDVDVGPCLEDILYGKNSILNFFV